MAEATRLGSSAFFINVWVAVMMAVIAVLVTAQKVLPPRVAPMGRSRSYSPHSGSDHRGPLVGSGADAPM